MNQPIRQSLRDIYGKDSTLTMFGKVLVTIGIPLVVLIMVVERLALKEEK